MKKSSITQSDIKEIGRLYTSGEISSTHKLAIQFKTTHKNIRTILTNQGISINKRGGQIKYGRNIVVQRYSDKNRTDGKTTIAICKQTNKLFNDYSNLSGALTDHIKKLHPNIVIPSSYKRRMIFKSTGKYWHEDYFDIIDQNKPTTKQCKYCNWETIDVDNKSGAYINHLKQKHNKTIEDFVIEFPEELVHYKQVQQKQNRDSLLTNPDEFMVCQICGEKFKHVNNQHLSTHGITPDEYKLQYGINSLMSNNLTAATSKRLKQYSDEFHFSPESKDENEIKNLIQTYGLDVIEHDRKILDGKEIDMVIHSLNLGIEYNGNKFHTEYYGHKYPNYHLDKLTLANSKGYGLIQIFEDEWILKKDLVVNKIKHLLGLSSGIKLGARKCDVKEILTYDKNQFLEKYHIQGQDTSTVKFGAFYNNELVAVMTFRPITVKEFELTRFSTNDNYIISGIASKLLYHFIKTYTPAKIISFADRRWTIKKDDNLYTKLGFKLTSITKPDYKYYNTKVHRYKRFHKFIFRKSNLVKKYGLDPKLTEKEMTQQLGYDRIWDCGLFKYELNVI